MSQKPKAEDILHRVRAFLHGTPQFEDVWPQDYEAEKGVVCCMIHDAPGCVALIQTKGITRDYFYDPRTANLAMCIVELIAEGRAVDGVTIAGKLTDKKIFESMGGWPFLNEMTCFHASPAHITTYLDRLINKFALRYAYQMGIAIAGRAAEKQDDTKGLLEELQKVAVYVSGIGQKATETTIRDQVAKVVNRRVQGPPGRIAGLSTHIPEMDAYTGGICDGHLVVIGGVGKKGKSRGSGKTSYATDLFRHMVYVHKRPAIFIQMEMSAEEMILRMVSAWAGIDMQKVKNRTCSEEDEGIIGQWLRWISESKMQIHDSGRLTMPTIAAKLRAFKAVNPTAKLGVIDHFQLIDARYPKEWSTARISEEVSGQLKGLARELEMCLVILSQLNEKGDTKGGKGLEEAADRVEILKHTDDGVFVLLEKNRHGDDQNETDGEVMIPVIHDRECVRFYPRNNAAA